LNIVIAITSAKEGAMFQAGLSLHLGAGFRGKRVGKKEKGKRKKKGKVKRS